MSMTWKWFLDHLSYNYHKNSYLIEVFFVFSYLNTCSNTPIHQAPLFFVHLLADAITDVESRDLIRDASCNLKSINDNHFLHLSQVIDLNLTSLIIT